MLRATLTDHRNGARIVWYPDAVCDEGLDYGPAEHRMMSHSGEDAANDELPPPEPAA